MSKEKQTKINRLISQWRRGTVATASYLNRLGFDHVLLAKYRRSGWLQSFGRGAYVLPGDRVEWQGALYAVQSQLGLEIHAGGKTALELKGYGHYVPAGKKRVFFYAKPRVILPAWFKGERLGVDLVLIRTNLFSEHNHEVFSEWKEREFSIRIASPERAAMEMLNLVPAKVGFDEALLVMEALTTLRPDVVQSLLEACCSVKVKRLFMYISEKHGHPWVGKLNQSRVDFGRGKRMIVSGGEFDVKYQITVPRSRKEEVEQ
jgi:hypothetical protein